MKKWMLLLGHTFASANIIFPYVQPTCSNAAATSRCLQGQICVENTCVASRYVSRKQDTVDSAWLCGKQHGGATCGVDRGPCCSQYGFCGATAEYCLVSNGCQSGCTVISQSSVVAPQPTSPSTPTSNPVIRQPSTTSGAALSEPIIGPASSVATAPTATGTPTTNGLCGATNNGDTCLGWWKGSCCSM